jgi:tetratricopeptide (TPR) repeat protein
MLKKKLNAKTEARLHEAIRRGHQLEKHQRFDEAAAEYRRALEIAPNDIDASQLLGMLYHHRGENDLAEPLLARVVKVRTRQADLQCAYGAILSAVGDHRRSITYYQKALELDPGYVIAQYNLSQELVYLGDTKGAIAGYQRAIEMQPLCVPAYQQLARLCKFTEYNEDVRIMEQLFEQFGGEERMLLAFGLSVVHQKLKNNEQSFAYLLEGNRIKRKTFDYTTSRTEVTFDQLRKAYTPEILADQAKPLQRDPTPIFIIGMPRSGTSLAEQILASHSEVHGCGELKNLGRIYHTVFDNNKPIPPQVAALPGEQHEEPARRYLDEVAAMAKGKRYATDKMPHNFLHVGFIARLLPNAKIIHCERNPLDTCLSIFSNLFTGLHPYAYNLEELGHYYLQYQQLMEYWHQVLPGRIYTLNYEQVVTDTETEVRKLLDFCGLPFEEGCLSFHENERAVVTVSSTQVRQPIYKSSVEGWRRYEKGLAPLRAVLGI